MLVEKGELEPDTRLRLLDTTFFELLKMKSIRIDLLYYNDKMFVYREPSSDSFPVSSLHLLNDDAFEENEFFEEKALLIEIASDNKRQSLKEKLESTNVEIKDNEKKPVKPIMFGLFLPVVLKLQEEQVPAIP